MFAHWSYDNYVNDEWDGLFLYLKRVDCLLVQFEGDFTSVPKNVLFPCYVGLIHLRINDSQITNIEPITFFNASNLNKIDISRNQITIIRDL